MYSHLSEAHMKLVRKYGLDAPDPATRQRRYDIHKKRGAGPNLDAAMRLASVSPSAYGKKKAPKKQLAVPRGAPKLASKANYNRALAKTRDPAKRQALRLARRAQRKTEQDQKVAHKQRLKKIRGNKAVKTTTFYDASNTATRKVSGKMSVVDGVYAHNALTPEIQARRQLADGLTLLVQGVDDLFRSVHSSLSELIYEFMRSGLGQRGARGARAAGTLATSMVPKDVYTFVIRKVLGVYGVSLDEQAFENHLAKADYKKVVTGLLAGKKRVDLVPMVRHTVMALDAGSVTKLTGALIDGVLNTYVRQKYVSSASGPSSICLLCQGRRPTCPPGTPPDTRAFASGVKKLLVGVNKILKIGGTNLTRETREALKTYVVDFNTASGRAVSTAALYASPAVARIAATLHCAISKLVRRWGFEISMDRVRDVVISRKGDLLKLVRGTLASGVEKFIVEIVTSVKPTEQLTLCRVCHMKCDPSFKIKNLNHNNRRGFFQKTLDGAKAGFVASMQTFKCAV